MSEGNGAGLVAPITVVYQLRAEREEALGRLADAERRAEAAERKLAELIAAGMADPDSAIGKRCVLEHELRGLRGG